MNGLEIAGIVVGALVVLTGLSYLVGALIAVWFVNKLMDLF